jgi:hypothetical protein
MWGIRFNLRFFATLPFAVLAVLAKEALARLDAKYGDALNGRDDA